jgi:hypothetical protein
MFTIARRVVRAAGYFVRYRKCYAVTAVDDKLTAWGWRKGEQV